MGRCLTFNFTLEELRDRMKDVRYFVYSPDFDSAGGSSDQHFHTALAAASQGAADEIVALIASVPMGSKLSHHFADGRLYLSLYSEEEFGAITERQIEDLRAVDRALARIGARVVPFERVQDVLFGETCFLAGAFAKPFQSKAMFHVPLQKNWFSGRGYKEASDRFHGSYLK